MFRGTYTALITPFHNGHIDETAFRSLIEQQVEAGVNGIVPVGTTGESPTLDPDEHLEVIRMAVDAAANRIEVIAGTGANSTSEAIHLTEEAEKLGIDGTLQVTPYYNKPSQEGLFQHFRAIAHSTNLPIMLYSVPGRSVVAIAPETASRLAAECQNIVSIKEAGGDPNRVDQLREALPEGFSILSGDDPLTIEFMKRGACGLVSVSSNIIPKVMVHLVSAMQEGNRTEAQSIHDKYEALFTAVMGLDTNPVPIKAAAAQLGLCQSEIRLPLVELHQDNQVKLAQVLKDYALL